MDWLAIGSIAAVVTAVVGYLQFRRKVEPIVVSSVVPDDRSIVPVKLREPPASIDYQIRTIGGSLPANLIEAIIKPLTTDIGDSFDDYMVGRDAVRNLNATTLEFMNTGEHAIRDIRLRLRISGRLFSLRVESVRKLPKESVIISVEDSSIRICLEEMPKDETVTIGVFHEGGYSGGELRSELANVDLRDRSYVQLLKRD